MQILRVRNISSTPLSADTFMEASQHVSVGDIIDRLLEKSLIDACHMTREYVTVVQGTKRHSISYKKARTFLMSLLRGRSWEQNASTSAEAELMPLRAVSAARGLRTETDRTADPALDELLRVAAEMHLIKEYARDAETRSVAIELAACRIEMREAEAVAYLAECILHELNLLRSGHGGIVRSDQWDVEADSWSALASKSVD
ncbi:MAG: hypothetical protein WD021_07960 [Rhodothermales bacterium]